MRISKSAPQNGVVLLAGSVNELEFRPSAVVTADNVYRADNTGLSGVYVGEQNLTPAANGNFSLSSGKLSGYFSIRDNVGTEFQAEIDALAGDLISRFSDDSIDSTKPAGAPGIFTDAGGPLNPANTAGLAGRLSLNAAIDPSQGGTVTRFRDGLAAATEGIRARAFLRMQKSKPQASTQITNCKTCLSLNKLMRQMRELSKPSAICLTAYSSFKR